MSKVRTLSTNLQRSTLPRQSFLKSLINLQEGIKFRKRIKFWQTGHFATDTEPFFNGG